MVCQNSYRLPLIYEDKYKRILKFAKLRTERFVKQYRLLVCLKCHIGQAKGNHSLISLCLTDILFSAILHSLQFFVCHLHI